MACSNTPPAIKQFGLVGERNSLQWCGLQAGDDVIGNAHDEERYPAEDLHIGLCAWFPTVSHVTNDW